MGGEWNGFHLVLAETCHDGSMHEVSSGMPLGFQWSEIDWWLPLELGDSGADECHSEGHDDGGGETATRIG